VASIAAEGATLMIPTAPKALAAAVAVLLAAGIFITAAATWAGRQRSSSAVVISPPPPPPPPTTPPTTPVAAAAPPAPIALELGGGVRMELIGIAAGRFLMGNTYSRPGQPVSIGSPFYMGKHEVTQGQWRAVMKSNPARFAELGDDHPVEQVMWAQCQEFCRRVSQLTGRRVRLPSDAEWEYACRAGTTGEFFFGNNAADLPRYAWQGVMEEGSYPWSSDVVRPADAKLKNGTSTHAVGKTLPNPWGLYDMYGNVYEWCQDDYAGRGQSYVGASRDGSARVVAGGTPAAAAAPARVTRGGSWGSHYLNELRSNHRQPFPAASSKDNIGLRIVVDLISVRG
jgi:formylglycine-generating enzyme required for sulfatase activity